MNHPSHVQRWRFHDDDKRRSEGKWFAHPAHIGSGRAILLLTIALFGLILSACASKKPQEYNATLTVEATPLISSTAEMSATFTKTPTSGKVETPGAPHHILGDLRLRQAMAYCTNRAELLRSVYPWLQDTSPYEMATLLPSHHWAYPQDDPDLRRYPFDPAQGKTLLEEAGWHLQENAIYRTNPQGQELRLSLVTTEAAFRKTWTQVFAEQMRDCGINVQPTYLPAEQFYGQEDKPGELARRHFDLAAYARVLQSEPQWREHFACDAIPTPNNDWRGQNFSGWCNLAVEQALRLAGSSPNPEDRQAAYRLIQEEYTRELPSLPLFTRLEVCASNPGLENFTCDPVKVYTWNAAQWRLPGREQIVIGERSEPAGLFPWDDSYVNQVISALVNGLDYYYESNYRYQPLLLKRIPSLENGSVIVRQVQVNQGAQVVDINGDVVELQEGVQVYDTQGNEVSFTGDTLDMNQLVVTFEAIDGLTWSDGSPVSRADYELSYKVLCSPETYRGEARYALPPGQSTPPVCDRIASVRYLSDTAYEVTWKPGFVFGCFGNCAYFLPPFGRLPAHFRLGDGRSLEEVPPEEWQYLDEVRAGLPGVGPYQLSRWIYGEEIHLSANPYYVLGAPATLTLIIRFIPQGATAEALIQSKVDVLDMTSLLPQQVEPLLAASAEGKVRVYVAPSMIYEQIAFALSQP